MAWRKKQQKSGSVEIVMSGRGLLMSGSAEDVGDAIAEFTRVAGGGTRSVSASDLVGAGTAAFGLVKTHKEYVQFSKKTWDLLKEHTPVAKGDTGYNQAFIWDTAKKFVDNVEWKKVKIGPEQALSIQTAGATLAVRAAIKDVLAAIERVEGKVDELVTLVRAERLGSATGDRRTLESAIQLLESSGTITTTDWMAIGPLGPEIARDIDRLRSHISLKLAEVKSGAMTRTRVDGAEELSEQLLRESIALLVVAEHNYGLWQQLRIASVKAHEPKQLRAVTASVHESIEAHYVADQALLDKISAAAGLLTSPTGFEGFEPFQRRRLSKLGRELDATVRWFADQRNLDVEDDHDIEYSGLGGSIAKTGKVAGTAIHSATKAVGRGVDRVRRDKPDDGSGD